MQRRQERLEERIKEEKARLKAEKKRLKAERKEKRKRKREAKASAIEEREAKKRKLDEERIREKLMTEKDSKGEQQDGDNEKEKDREPRSRSRRFDSYFNDLCGYFSLLAPLRRNPDLLRVEVLPKEAGVRAEEAFLDLVLLLEDVDSLVLVLALVLHLVVGGIFPLSLRSTPDQRPNRSRSPPRRYRRSRSRSSSRSPRRR